jgi:hypothetical protein
MEKLKKTSETEPPPKRESAMVLVFGRPMPNLYVSKLKKPLPRDFKTWRQLLSRTWKEYVDTFEGFLWIDEKKREEALEAREKDLAKIKGMVPKKQEVQRNLKKNYVFMRYEGRKLINQAKEVTGIRTREDLRQVLISTLQLINDCLNEFMTGYRKGRDDEMKLMMTRDFGELFKAAWGDDDKPTTNNTDNEKKTKKPPRRRIKPRKRL